MSAGHQRFDLGSKRRGQSNLVHQFWQQRNGRAQGVENLGRPCQSAVEQTVDEVFYCPGKLTEFAHAYHAATALERMERTARDAERVRLKRILIPDRVVGADFLQLFARLFSKQIE